MKMNKCRQMIIAAFFALVLTVTSVQGVFAAAVGGQQVSSDSKLSEFGVHPGTLSPAFSPDVLDYTATVEAGTTAVDVRAVPRAVDGVIASVEGARTLQPGVNTVKVTCSAPDNSFTVYTITITVGSANGTTGAENDTEGQTTGDTGTQGDTNGTQGQTTGDANGTQGQTTGDTNGTQGQGTSDSGTQDTTTKKKKKKSASLLGAVAADGTVTLSGATYRLSSNFSYGSYSQDIPSAFGQGSLQIGGNSYPTLHCEANGIDLVYMENTDGKGSTGFYYYDEIQNAVERFKYTGIGDNFVVFISSARAEVPEGFQSKTLKLPSEKKVAAYQNKESADMQDFYLIYGINSDGSNGWYLYDDAQGTYMRYVPVAVSEENPEIEGEMEPSVSLDKYNLLNEKYTKLKSNMVKSVSCFVIGIVLLIILFTAIILRGKDKEDEDDGTEKKTQERKLKKKLKKVKKQTETVPKSSLAAGRQMSGKATKGETKKITKTITSNYAEEEQPYTAVPPVSADMQQAGQAGPDMGAQAQRKRELDVRPQMSRAASAPRIQSDYVQQPVTPPVMPQATQQPVRMQQPAHPQPAARHSLLKKESPSGSDDSMRIAAEKMRQSVRRPVNSQAAMMNTEQLSEAEFIDEESAGPKSKIPQRKKRTVMEDEVDIMDLNDL